eukprot:6131357-Amphidinium_carterae.1
MLTNGNSRGKAQAARAMFGIAVPEVEANRTAIVSAGSLLPLVAIVRAGDSSCAEGRAWAASTLRLLASSPARRRAIEDAVPVVAPHGRKELMAQIHAAPTAKECKSILPCKPHDMKHLCSAMSFWWLV